MRLFLAGTGLLLLLGAAPASAACDPAALHHAIEDVADARKALRALPIADGEETQVTVPAQAAIATMKTRIAAYVLATLQCRPDGDAKALAAALLVAAAAAGPSDTGYGTSLDFTVQQPMPRLLVVNAAFGISCGSDTMLMVFAPAKDGWREVLRLQSKPYDTVAGAYDFFDYAISPPDAAGNWFLAQKNITPWCSSTWATIRYSVLRPSADPLQPRVLLDGSDPVWWGNEDYGRLSVAAQNFTLRFHAESFDGGVHNREWIRRYSVQGDVARRIPPFAASPRDFVDEWIVSDWPLMAPWTARPQLRALHDAFKRDGGPEYDSVRRCKQAGRMQIEVDGGDGQPHYFFLVAAGADMRMLDVTRVPDRTCTGPNLFLR
jgi:hypothetical protein